MGAFQVYYMMMMMMIMMMMMMMMTGDITCCQLNELLLTASLD